MVKKKSKKKAKSVKSQRPKKLFSNALIVGLICAVLITVGLVLLFFSLFAIYKVYDVPMELEIANRSAFNTDTDAIDFGKAMPGNSNTRVMVLAHNYKKPLLVQFKASGNITQFIHAPPEFYLEPGVTREIAVNAVVPGDAGYAHYDGNMRVYFRRI